MVSERYSLAMSETLHYLKGINQRDIDKIPSKFIDFLKLNSMAGYKCDFDYNKPLNELKLKDETYGIISMICLNYWCETEEEKEAFKRHLNNNEQKYQEELKEKYHIDKLFDNRRTKIIDETKNEDTSLINVKESFINRILNRIRYFLKNR